MIPATIATIVPASKACCMNSYWNICWRSLNRLMLKFALLVGMVIVNSNYADVAPGILENLNVDSKQVAELLRSQNFLWRSCRHFAVRNVYHPIQKRKQWVDIVRNEQRGNIS